MGKPKRSEGRPFYGCATYILEKFGDYYEEIEDGHHDFQWGHDEARDKRGYRKIGVRKRSVRVFWAEEREVWKEKLAFPWNRNDRTGKGGEVMSLVHFDTHGGLVFSGRELEQWRMDAVGGAVELVGANLFDACPGGETASAVFSRVVGSFAERTLFENALVFGANSHEVWQWFGCHGVRGHLWDWNPEPGDFIFFRDSREKIVEHGLVRSVEGSGIWVVGPRERSRRHSYGAIKSRLVSDVGSILGFACFCVQRKVESGRQVGSGFSGNGLTVGEKFGYCDVHAGGEVRFGSNNEQRERHTG